jgi:acyl carrier protein
MGPLGYAVLAAMLAALFYLAWNHPFWTGGSLVALAILVVVENRWRRVRMAKLAARRPSTEGICEFARSFDSRHIDTWVIRAVYEELHSYFHVVGVNIAIRADDDLAHELGIDSEDLEMDIVLDIAQRTGRSLKDTKQNPYYDKVRTARDLVMFFNAQPKDRAI